MIRRCLRIIAIVLAVGSFFSCFWPDIRNRQTDEERDTVVDVGLPISPWLHLEDHTVERRLPGGSVQSSSRHNWNVQFISWSFVMPVLSLGLFWTARRLRVKKPAA